MDHEPSDLARRPSPEARGTPSLDIVLDEYAEFREDWHDDNHTGSYALCKRCGTELAILDKARQEVAALRAAQAERPTFEDVERAYIEAVGTHQAWAPEENGLRAVMALYAKPEPAP